MVIKELSRSTLPLVFLATFLTDSEESSQVISHLQPTRRRNLSLAITDPVPRRTIRRPHHHRSDVPAPGIPASVNR